MSIRVPEEYICPITNEIMVDPVIDPDGNSYEREAIMNWLNHQQTSPITRHFLLPTQLAPNRALKNIIETFKLNTGYESNGPEDAKPEAKTTPAESKVKPIMLYVVVDTSESMKEPCDYVDDGYSRLDLVKHTLNTLITALSDADYACTIKFSTVADVFIPLTQLTENNKKLLIQKLQCLEPENQGNLWDGIRLAIDEISSLGDIANDYNIQIYVLTDGKSNNIPSNLLKNVIRSNLELKCSHLEKYPMINTFGYGNSCFSDSETLLTTSKVANGFFGFIPDVTMVGPVFINALSNSIIQDKPRLDETSQLVCEEFIDLLNKLLITEEHQYDDRLFLLIKFNTFLDQIVQRIGVLVIRQSTIDFINNLKEDCSPSLSRYVGQVSKAIEKGNFYYWGVHYLRSVLSAYINRICINFNDKGLQIFKTTHFVNEQKRITDIFVQLPPPVPSRFIMSNYHNNYTVRGRYSNESYLPSASTSINATNYDFDENGDEETFHDFSIHSPPSNLFMGEHPFFYLPPLTFHSDEENESVEEEDAVPQLLPYEDVEILDEVFVVDPEFNFLD